MKQKRRIWGWGDFRAKGIKLEIPGKKQHIYDNSMISLLAFNRYSHKCRSKIQDTPRSQPHQQLQPKVFLLCRPFPVIYNLSLKIITNYKSQSHQAQSLFLWGHCISCHLLLGQPASICFTRRLSSISQRYIGRPRFTRLLRPPLFRTSLRALVEKAPNKSLRVTQKWVGLYVKNKISEEKKQFGVSPMRLFAFLQRLARLFLTQATIIWMILLARWIMDMYYDI